MTTFVTKRALPRRTFVRGMGTALALPLLDAMVPALATGAQARAAAAPRRLGFVYLPNGVAMNFGGVNYWRPQGEGPDYEMSRILSPLAPFRRQLLVLSGLSQRAADAADDGANGDHTRATATWLTGVRPRHTEGADVQNGVSADQIAAAALGRDTALPSLELCTDLNYLAGNCENGYSCVYLNTLAWTSTTTPLPSEHNPSVVFKRLFGDGGSAEQRLTRGRQDRSILDSVIGEFEQIRKTLGPEDRTTLGAYLESVREVERRVRKLEDRGGQADLPDLERPTGVPPRFDEHVELLFDLQRLALQADLTRVTTFMLGRELNFRTYPEIGITEGHHGLSHHRDDLEQLDRYSRVNVHQAQLFARFLEKLQATPDGDGTLLDHSMFLYGAGLSNPNLHMHFDLPLAVVGGGVKGGRHLVYPVDTPMTNLLLALLDRAGVPAETLGDSTGRLEVAPLSDV
jgi:hypothetical protein